MSSYWKWPLTLIALGLKLWSANAALSNLCWEQSFKTAGIERYRYHELYNDILETALEIKSLKIIYNVQKVAFLIDSAIGSKYNMQDNLLTEKLQNATNIFKFQLELVGIFQMILDVPSYLIQYDESAAWTCDELGCLYSCQGKVGITKQSPIELGPTSHCPGNIEAACSLAHKQLSELTCLSDSNSTEMIVAITNGNFELNDGKERHHKGRRECPGMGFDSFSSSEESFSPCLNFFQTRYVVGTHGSSKKVMDRLPSLHGNYRYINAELFSYDGLKQLFADVGSACCPGLSPPLTVSTCKKTQGPLGEIVLPFTTHPGTSSSYNALS